MSVENLILFQEVHPAAFLNIQCSVFLHHIIASSLKVVAILLYNCMAITKKLLFLKDFTHAGDALLMFCFGVIFVLGLWWISSPGFGASCKTIL